MTPYLCNSFSMQHKRCVQSFVKIPVWLLRKKYQNLVQILKLDFLKMKDSTFFNFT